MPARICKQYLNNTARNLNMNPKYLTQIFGAMKLRVFINKSVSQYNLISFLQSQGIRDLKIF